MALGLLGLLMLTASSAGAQIFPTATPTASSERVILDATMVLESPDDPSGLCTEIEPGILTVRARLLVSDPPTPAVFGIGPDDRDGDYPIMLPLAPQEQTATATLMRSGVVYCWGISVQMPGQVGHRPAQETRASIRMTIAPK